MISQITTFKKGDVAVQRAKIAEGKDGSVEPAPLSFAEAAAIAGVNRSTIEAARSVRERGTTEEKEAVAKGEAAALLREKTRRRQETQPSHPRPRPTHLSRHLQDAQPRAPLQDQSLTKNPKPFSNSLFQIPAGCSTSDSRSLPLSRLLSGVKRTKSAR